ncbi:MAG: hypothetical protein ABIW79_03140, partial [Gemmatimonas sp.]
MPCFEIIMPMRRRVGPATGTTVDTARNSWPASLAGTQLIGPGIIRLGYDSTQRIRLLVVVDVSGSMKGEGMAFTRSAVRGFLSALPKTGLEVALVPFESRRVAAR